MNKIFAFVTFIIFHLFAYEIYAEDSNFRIEGLYQKNLVESPEVSTIKYHFIQPVNYSTGKVDITIPLLDVDCGSLKLPIYLSYNTSGVKVNDPCGWVGQNWSLHCEPTVSRIIRGHIDGVNGAQIRENISYFDAKHYLDSNILDSNDDAMPDEYYFSLLNGGGMFVYSKTSKESDEGKFMCVPYDDTKIINSRHIVSSDGTNYLYYGAEDVANQPAIYTTCWHASKVIGANGIDSIVFTYGTKYFYETKRMDDNIHVVDAVVPYSYAMSHSYTNRIEASDVFDPSGFHIDPELLMPIPIVYLNRDDQTDSYLFQNGHLESDGGLREKQNYYPNVNVVSEHVSHIRYRNNDVQFITDANNPNLLREIKLVNQKGKEIRRIKFEYDISHFRHYLKQVSIISDKSERTETYSFEYNNYDVLACGTSCVDFWGYDNGTFDEQTMVPKTKLYTQVYSNDNDIIYSMLKPDSMIIGCSQRRGSNECHMRNGVLKSITYPTGARQTFVFEANRARIPKSELSENSEFNISEQLIGKNGIYQLGGLRIKEITIEDESGVLQRRCFVYGKKEDGAGTSPIFDGINYFLRTQEKYYAPNRSGVNAHSRYRTLSSSPVFPLTYYNGSSVIYESVTEYNGNPDSSTCKTVYSYSIPGYKATYLTPDDFWDPNTNYSSWYQENLISKEIYEKEDGEFVLKTLETNVYSRAPKSEYKIIGRQYRVPFHDSFSESEANSLYTPVYFDKRDYSEPIKSNLLTRQEHREFCRNGVITTTTTFGYGQNDNQITGKTVSRGDFSVSESYSHPQQMGDIEPYKQMVEKNMLSPIVEARYSYNGEVGMEKTEIYEKVNGSMYLPTKLAVRTPEMSEAIIKTTCKYDSKGNPVLIAENGVAKAIVWDVTGEKILAVVETSASDAETDSFKEYVKKLMPGESVSYQTNPMTTKGGEQSRDDEDIPNEEEDAADSDVYVGDEYDADVDDKEEQSSDKWRTVLSAPLSPSECMPNGRYIVTFFSYDEYDRLASIRKPNGQTLRYSYDGLHRLVEVRNTKNDILEKYVYHNKNIK